MIGYLGSIGDDSIILIPGGEVAARRYSDLAQEIVAQNPHISVFITKFAGDTVSPWSLGTKVTKVLSAMKSLGWQEPQSSAYLGAHSMGGILGFSQVEKLGLKGLILLASYLPEAVVGGSPHTVATFPKPILVLGAEWDRRVDLHIQARAFAQFAAWRQDNPTNTSKMVGVLPGASHMQFADGELLPSDVAPTRSNLEVRREIAQLIGAFLRLQSPGRDPSKDLQDQEAMDKLVETSQAAVSPIFFGQRFDQSACAWLQERWDGGVEDGPPNEVLNIQSYGAFALSRPKAGVRGAWQVPMHLEQPPNPFDLPGTPFGIPVALSCKLIVPRQAASTQHHGDTLCRDADRLISEAVARSLTTAQKARADASQSQVTFSSKKVHSMAQWLVTPTGFRNKGKVTAWESHSVISQERLQHDRDLVTCKLTPPTRWLFYYLRDAHLTGLEGALRL